MFSVGICSSDREGFLLEALDSVLKQDFTGPIQVVVADDNSTNFSPTDTLTKLASTFKSRGILLRLVSHDTKDGVELKNKKLGEGAMRNSVINNATNDFIVWLDDDDRLIPTALSTYAAEISKFPETEVFYGNLVRTDEKFNPQRLYKYRDIPRSLLPSSMLLGSIIPNGGSCIKKTVFEKIGLYDPSFIVATDYQFWARAALGPIRFKHVDSEVYLYRAHDSNAALDKEDDRFFETNSKVCELLLRSCPPNYLFPFFEWKTDKSLAECQVTLAILALSKKNKNKFLTENCLAELSNNESFANHKQNQSIKEILSYLANVTTLSFDETADTLTKIVQISQNQQQDQQANQ